MTTAALASNPIRMAAVLVVVGALALFALLLAFGMSYGVGTAAPRPTLDAGIVG